MGLFSAYVCILRIPREGVLLPGIPCVSLLPPGTMFSVTVSVAVSIQVPLLLYFS